MTKVKKDKKVRKSSGSVPTDPIETPTTDPIETPTMDPNRYDPKL